MAEVGGSAGNRHSEYGGGPGEPQRKPDGSAKQHLDPGEAARVLRMVGLQGDIDLNQPDGDPPEMERAKAEREIDAFFGIGSYDKMTPGERRAAERKRLKAISNGYSEEPDANITGDRLQ